MKTGKGSQGLNFLPALLGMNVCFTNEGEYFRVIEVTLNNEDSSFETCLYLTLKTLLKKAKKKLLFKL